jgi:hypothetical protein
MLSVGKQLLTLISQTKKPNMLILQKKMAEEFLFCHFMKQSMNVYFNSY